MLAELELEHKLAAIVVQARKPQELAAGHQLPGGTQFKDEGIGGALGCGGWRDQETTD